MQPLESVFRQQYSDLIKQFTDYFPGVKPPDSSWFANWLGRYGFRAISDAMGVLASHSLKAQFTTQSTGKAISALLRDDALRRATIAPAAGERQ